MIRIKLKSNRVHIEAYGIEFLRIKTAIINQVSESCIDMVSSNEFSVPLACVPIIIAQLENGNHCFSEEPKDFLEQRLQEQAEHLIGKLEADHLLSSNSTPEMSRNWNTILKPFQARAAKALLVNGLLGGCLFDEQGVGKTVTTISVIDEMLDQGKVDVAVILAPKSVLNEWKKEIERYLSNKYTFIIVEGEPHERQIQLNRSCQIYCMTYESVQRHLSTIQGMLREKSPILIVDESHYVKNQSAIRSVAIRDLRKICKFGLVLCGTPAPNSPIDIINQFDIADDGFTFAGFRAPRDPEELKRAIMERIAARGLMIRRLKSEVLPDLASKLFTIHKVKLGPKQQALYDATRASIVLQLKQIDNRTFLRNISTYLQKRSVLLQICVNPAMIDPLFTDTPAKYLAMDALLNDILSFGKKVVIWSYFTESIRDICTRYNSLGVVYIDGSTPIGMRAKVVEDFQTNPSIKVFVGNPAAAGAGITLHAASNAVYLSYSNQLSHFLQSVDRIHRIGQVADIIETTLLVAEGTIEEKEVSRLSRKASQQHEILNDRTNFPSSLEEAISELEDA